MIERPLVNKTRSLSMLLNLAFWMVSAGVLEAQLVAYTGATVWDGTDRAPADGAILLVEDGVIRDLGPAVTIPPAAEVVSLEGRYVIPGLINTHGHVSGRWATEAARDEAERIREDLLLYARYGVTTVNSLGDGPVALEIAGQPHGRRPHARLVASGAVVTGSDPASARRQARANVEAGAEWLKLRVDDNLGTSRPMPWNAVEAVFEVGREAGVPVATHLFYLEDARRLLEMGTGMVAHSIRDREVDAAFTSALAASGVCYVPTLTRELSTFVYGERPDFFDDPFFQRFATPDEVERLEDPAVQARFREDPTAAGYRRALDQATANLRALRGAGVRVGFGTDSGPAARFPGYFEHLELWLMVEAGLTPVEALRSATGVAAECLGRDDIGTLETGRAADFLVLEADPTVDIEATRSLERVFVGGLEVPMPGSASPAGR